MTTVEHALPVPELFDDVLTLFALSGTGSTPTHIVNYGGAWGEQYVWATEDIPNDPKLRRFTRHDILESLSESTTRPRNCECILCLTRSELPADAAKPTRCSTRPRRQRRWCTWASRRTSARTASRRSG